MTREREGRNRGSPFLNRLTGGEDGLASWQIDGLPGSGQHARHGSGGSPGGLDDGGGDIAGAQSFRQPGSFLSNEIATNFILPSTKKY